MGTEVCLYIYFSCFFRRIHGFFLFFQRKCYFLPEEEPPFPLEEEETAFLEFFFLPFCVSSFWSFLPPLLKLGEEEGASVLGLREGSVLEGDSTSKGNDKDSSSKESFGREKVAEHSMFCDSSRRGGSNSMQKQIPGSQHGSSLLKLGEEEGASVLGLREGSVLEGDSTSKGNDKDSSSKESFGREKVAEHSMFCDSSRRGGSNSMQKQIPGLDNNFLNVVVVKQFESPAAAHPNDAATIQATHSPGVGLDVGSLLMGAEIWSFLPPLLKLGEEEGASVLGLREGSVLEGDSTGVGLDVGSLLMGAETGAVVAGEVVLPAGMGTSSPVVR
eukprot:CAMPEP_0172471884 /NCGR_PEP_ID=MMETSP1065-20121228/68041_1 /TAXON_ID=265537 /ORGANISM="Amphiprora paludosa, Strain CCMP125" /LENGTH=329 /DNA_ID=CAMNT_0013229999 /DNA_START=357 /DNA_END=1347 /DNA_ORIENTATION=-